MARKYLSSKRGQMVTIHGFAEMIETLSKLESRGVDEVTGRIFDECCDTVKNAIDTHAQQSLPADLASKTTQFKVKRGNVFMFAYGWDRHKDPEDFLKVCYLNYGTPHRYTAKSEQRVKINGQWVTLGNSRGKIAPRGFLSNAKRSAAQKINAKKRTMMKEILNGGGNK